MTEYNLDVNFGILSYSYISNVLFYLLRSRYIFIVFETENKLIKANGYIEFPVPLTFFFNFSPISKYV